MENGQKTKFETGEDGKVAMILMKDGTHFGKLGDTIRVDVATAESLARIRTNDHGGGKVVEYRLARPENEIESPIPISSLTQAEAANLGIKNTVATPKDTILPASLAGKSDKQIQEAAKKAGLVDGKDDKKPAAKKATVQKAATTEAKADQAPPAAKKINPPEASAST